MKFSARNAATGEVLTPEFTDATAHEISDAAESARRVADVFAATAPELRAALLETIVEELTARGDAWVARAQLETGLPAARLEGERARTTGQLRLFASVVREGSWVDARIDPALPDRKPLPRVDLRRMLIGIGPVAVFGASNFPFAFSVAGGDTASALAAGNPVVVKAHPAHPGTSEIAAEAIRAAVRKLQLPDAIFSMLHGSSPDVSIALVKHPGIAAVGFTGSTKAGQALVEAAAAREVPIPVFAEMSSVNPLFALPQALQQRGAAIAEGFVSSFTLGMGQFCTKPGLVFGLAGADWDNFCKIVAEKAEKVVPATMLHAGIKNGFEHGVGALKGVRWLTQSGGRIAAVAASELREHPELGHEIFGPFALLVTARDKADILATVETLEGQLTATLHGTPEELSQWSELTSLLTRKAGRLVFNGYPTGVEVCHAMHHGGPYPSTSDARFTSVGTAAILRFARPVCYQNWPESLLPEALQNANPQKLLRMVNGQYTRDSLS
jgi:2,5-dioxopentanoate dehydrogenase